MVNHASLFGVAFLCRLALAFLPVAYVSAGQRSLWSWPFFCVFALCFAAAVPLAASAGLPRPPDTLIRRRELFAPVAVGTAVALLTIWSDLVSPVAIARNVPTVHVHGWAAVPFYVYGAILLTVVFHFLPIAFVAWCARRLPPRLRLAILIIGVLAVAFSEDANYFLRARSLAGVEAGRHALSVVANGAEALFILRLGLLGGLTQRLTTYLLWHLAWPLVAQT